ncbi:hypothetical protein E2C01_061441 [Portunus trituberculatus]|uniref:Uncharacterized protein n=1 Tax=Portunus trituberculatus TaxID=210409 RepID=A0A5B7HED7_PORTR|nr:hypothetical protein [Portunus trituberculatus]
MLPRSVRRKNIPHRPVTEAPLIVLEAQIQSRPNNTMLPPPATQRLPSGPHSLATPTRQTPQARSVPHAATLPHHTRPLAKRITKCMPYIALPSHLSLITGLNISIGGHSL